MNPYWAQVPNEHGTEDNDVLMIPVFQRPTARTPQTPNPHGMDDYETIDPLPKSSGCCICTKRKLCLQTGLRLTALLIAVALILTTLYQTGYEPWRLTHAEVFHANTKHGNMTC